MTKGVSDDVNLPKAYDAHLRECDERRDRVVAAGKEFVEDAHAVTTRIIEETVRVRQSRVALTGEIGQMTTGLRDVRNFLLDDKHEEEIRRLSALVSLCERLVALRASGDLDRIVDVLIRFAAKEVQP